MEVSNSEKITYGPMIHFPASHVSLPDGLLWGLPHCRENYAKMPYHLAPAWLSNTNIIFQCCVKALAKPTHELLVLLSGFTESFFLTEDWGRSLLTTVSVPYVFLGRDTRWTKGRALFCVILFLCFVAAPQEKEYTPFWSIVVPHGNLT